MATSFSTTLRNTIMAAVTSAAGTTANLMVWTGSAPAKSANAFVAPTGTLLATFALPNPIAPAASVGVLTLSAITNVTAAASGTPGYYRICTGSTDTNGSTVISQGSAAVGSGDLDFASTVASGGSVGITAFTYTEGDA